jgi:hypothetical protein
MQRRDRLRLRVGFRHWSDCRRDGLVLGQDRVWSRLLQQANAAGDINDHADDEHHYSINVNHDAIDNDQHDVNDHAGSDDDNSSEHASSNYVNDAAANNDNHDEHNDNAIHNHAARTATVHHA